MTKATYLGNCVGWPQHDVDSDGGLCDMISSGRSISRSTFLRHVARRDRETVETALGYALRGGRDLTMRRDWHVAYYRGVLHGVRVWFFKHSAIEYVFRP